MIKKLAKNIIKSLLICLAVLFAALPALGEIVIPNNMHILAANQNENETVCVMNKEDGDIKLNYVIDCINIDGTKRWSVETEAFDMPWDTLNFTKDNELLLLGAAKSPFIQHIDNKGKLGKRIYLPQTAKAPKIVNDTVFYTDWENEPIIQAFSIDIIHSKLTKKTVGIPGVLLFAESDFENYYLWVSANPEKSADIDIVVLNKQFMRVKEKENAVARFANQPEFVFSHNGSGDICMVNNGHNVKTLAILDSTLNIKWKRDIKINQYPWRIIKANLTETGEVILYGLTKEYVFEMQLSANGKTNYTEFKTGFSDVFWTCDSPLLLINNYSNTDTRLVNFNEFYNQNT